MCASATSNSVSTSPSCSTLEAHPCCCTERHTPPLRVLAAAAATAAGGGDSDAEDGDDGGDDTGRYAGGTGWLRDDGSNDCSRDEEEEEEEDGGASGWADKRERDRDGDSRDGGDCCRDADYARCDTATGAAAAAAAAAGGFAASIPHAATADRKASRSNHGNHSAVLHPPLRTHGTHKPPSHICLLAPPCTFEMYPLDLYPP
ncbi:unnamed protein product [Closterium sp. NIES-53]